MSGKMKSQNKPIRICFIAPKAYPLFNPESNEVFGGSEVDLYFLAVELARDKNYQVSFITADYGQRPIETIEGVTVIKSVDFDRNALHGVLRVWRSLGRAGADIYMIKTPSLGTFLTALYCRWHHRIFLYRSAHTDHCDGTYLKHHRVLGRLFEWALRTAKIVFVQNQTDIENLKRTTGVFSMMVPNGHRLDELRETKRQTILWTGRSASFKKPEKFIALAREFPEQSFVMICQRATGDNQYEQFCKQVREVPNLEFHQRVPFHQIDGFFQRARVFVNTSDTEGFPNTFIQACKCATPILSLNVNPDDFLNRYSCGVCCRGDSTRLAEGLKFMLDQQRYLQLGQNGRKYVLEHHDIKKIIEHYKKVFVSLRSQQEGEA